MELINLVLEFLCNVAVIICLMILMFYCCGAFVHFKKERLHEKHIKDYVDFRMRLMRQAADERNNDSINRRESEEKCERKEK